MADIRKLNTADVDFREELDALLAWESVSDSAVNDVVQDVIAQIRARGDAALVARQLAAVEAWRPDYGAVYRALARVTVDLARDAGGADAEGLAEIAQLARDTSPDAV